MRNKIQTNRLAGVWLTVQLMAAVLFAAQFQALGSADSPRERISLNDNWLFTKGDPANTGDQLSYEKLKPWINVTSAEFSTNAPTPKPEGNPGANVDYTQTQFDDHGWRKLILPHDWAIEGPFEQKFESPTGKLKYWGAVWYRKHIDIPASDTGRKLFLEIDGAMSFAEVWLNGQFIGGRPNGYASFELDLTPFIKVGGSRDPPRQPLGIFTLVSRRGNLPQRVARQNRARSRWALGNFRHHA
jgi:beta-galactosidase